MWKDFLYYTKRERQGIIVLLLCIITTFLIPYFLPLFSPTPQHNLQDSINFEKTYQEFVQKLETIPYAKQKYHPRLAYQHSPKQTIQLVPFDPNTADSTTFSTLGLPKWMIKNIMTYRKRKGKFRKPEDFQKIYGLSKEQFQTLRPYIYINPQGIQKDTIRLLATTPPSKDTLYKYEPGVTIELNIADTTELKKIPGIGSGIARMIIAYRNRLGGYYCIEQLKEIHLKAELLRPWFTINLKLIQPLSINQASIRRMMRHPYFNFYQAKVIAEHRKKYGDLHSLKELSLYEEFTSNDLERMAPYVNFQ